MCAMFCKARGLQTSLQSAEEEQGRRNHRAPAVLNNVRKQRELQEAYRNSLFLHGDSKPLLSFSSICCQDTTEDPVARIQIAATKSWNLPTSIEGQRQSPSGFSTLLELIPMAS